MTVLVVALAAVVALLAVLVIGLLRAHAEVLRALHELGLDDVLDPNASAAAGTSTDDADISRRTVAGVSGPQNASGKTGHDIQGATPDGGMTRVAVTGVDHLTLVAFLSSGCLTCSVFWEAFTDPAQRSLPGADTRLVVVTKSPSDESPSRVAELAPAGVTVLMSNEAWDDYDIPVSPYFLLVDGSDGRIVGEGAAASWDQVKGLLGQAMADAGFDTEGRVTPSSVVSGRAREERIDDELANAGISPGDPRLYLPTAEERAAQEGDR